MKILIYIKPFYPLLGGFENVVENLAGGFAAQGHQVKLVTLTPGDNEKDREMFPFEIIRSPGLSEYFRFMRWCDVFLQGGLALRGAWPLLFLRRPYVVAHGGWYYHPGKNEMRELTKHLLTAFTTLNICPSRAVADHILGRKVVIPNPYRDDIFFERNGVKRTKDLIFVGRLVSVKGADVLLKSVALLRDGGHVYNLTIVGSGPEEERLRSLAEGLGIGGQISFAGMLESEKVAKALCEHKVLVVPSVYQEPFGIVALEGIACGCSVVGTEGGGLAEAIGPCGLTVPNGDARALAAAVARVFHEPELVERFKAAAPEHLKNHSREKIVKTYLEILELADGSKLPRMGKANG